MIVPFDSTVPPAASVDSSAAASVAGVVLLSAAAWLLSSVLLPHPANTLTAKTPAKILDNTLYFIKLILLVLISPLYFL